jgi:hypothetical protein
MCSRASLRAHIRAFVDSNADARMWTMVSEKERRGEREREREREEGIAHQSSFNDYSGARIYTGT